MSKYLAIQWSRAGIRGLAAELNGDTIRVRASLAWDWPTDADMTDSEGLGRWLKSQLDELDAGDCRLLVVLSREDVVLRLLGLPATGEDNLPDLVRHQTGARSSVSLDQLALDYVPLTATPPQGGRWVQAATVPQRVVTHIRTCATAAGLDLCTVGISTYALGEMITQAAHLEVHAADQHRLIVHVVDGQLEVALWQGTDLLFGHVARAADAHAASVEVGRALVSHEGTVGPHEIGRVWLIAPPDRRTELQATLATRLGCEVLTLDPSQDLPTNVKTNGSGGDGASFAAALGALQAHVRPVVPTVDFLHPRRRVEKRNPTKTLVAIAAGLLLLLLPAGYLTTRFYLDSLAQRIAAKEGTVRQQGEYLAAGKPTQERVEFLSSWDNQRLNWLAEMQQIGAAMPGTERIYLDRWRFDISPGEAQGATEAVGFARQRQDAERLTQRLAEQPRYRVQPNAIGAGGEDPEYPILFQLDAEVRVLGPQPARSKRE